VVLATRSSDKVFVSSGEDKATGASELPQCSIRRAASIEVSNVFRSWEQIDQLKQQVLRKILVQKQPNAH